MENRTETHEMPQPLGMYAQDLYIRAKEYWSATKTLYEHSSKTEFVKYYLISHSLELFMKSYLASENISKKDMRCSKKLGHNLIKLHEKCSELSMPDVNNLKTLCERLQVMNSDYDFRYPSGYKLILPKFEILKPIVDELETTLNALITQAHISSYLYFRSATSHLKGIKIQWND